MTEPPLINAHATDPMDVFDRHLVRRHRDRAAFGFGESDFLFREIGERLTGRLGDIRRAFPLALDLGAHAGWLGQADGGAALRAHGVAHLISADLSPEMGRAARRAGTPLVVTADEEMLPFAPASLDLVISNLSMHWVNDLPGALLQIRAALKPDGLLLAAMLGGETLWELRDALYQAENMMSGGVSPRVSPFADAPDASGLMTRAGFALPVVDVDSITVTYPDMFRLMADLRAMGETNAVRARARTPLRRSVLLAAAEAYRTRHGDADGRIPATFQVLYLTGWAPAVNQQQPLRPGAAANRLADALGADEVSTGIKAGPGGRRRP